MSEPLFLMRNQHVSSCGEPPCYTNDVAGRYHGYFENRHGDQWVFVYDRAIGQGTLRGGGAGWTERYEVIDGAAVGLVLDDDERQWLGGVNK
jgi:hypothetical protein